MTIGKRALSFATALVLGATIVGLSAAPAAAEAKKPTKPKEEKMCTLDGDVSGTGNDIDFYVPGDYALVHSGPQLTPVYYECQDDGTWDEVELSRPRVPGRVPSGTFGQNP